MFRFWWVSRLPCLDSGEARNPDGWEGDSRLNEALASGALVLADRMVSPPPELQDGAVLFYNSTAHLLALIAWANANPSDANAIARRGVAAVRTAGKNIDDILHAARELKAGAHGQGRLRSRVFVAEPAEPNATGNGKVRHYYDLFGKDWARPFSIGEGIEQSTHAERTRTLEEADVVLLPLWNFVVAGEPVERTVGHYASVRRHSQTLVALDWSDAPQRLLTADPRVDLYFKRSRVLRQSGRLAAYPREVRPLFYPIKPRWHGLLTNLSHEAPRSGRPVDVACFFNPSTTRKTRG